LFVKDNKLHYVHNYVGAQEFHVESGDTVPEGKSILRYEFEPTGNPDFAKGKGSAGRAQLYIDGKLVGQVDLPVTVPLLIGLGGGLTVGRNPGSPVSQLYGLDRELGAQFCGSSCRRQRVEPRNQSAIFVFIPTAQRTLGR